jgi:hypothetical protein
MARESKEMSDRLYSIRGSWWRDTEDATTIGSRFLETLDSLKPLSPVMANWLLMDFTNSKPIPIAEARGRIKMIVEKGVSKDDDRRADPNGGFAAFARGGEIESEFGRSDSVNVNVRAGARWLNELSFSVGDTSPPTDPNLATYKIYRGALGVLASVWPCPYLEAYLFVMDSPPLISVTDPSTYVAPVEPPREDYIFPWIVYLSAPFAAGLTPPADLICERTPGGGLILSATRERFDPDDPGHMRCTRMLQTIMAERVKIHKNPLAGEETTPLAARVGPY